LDITRDAAVRPNQLVVSINRSRDCRDAATFQHHASMMAFDVNSVPWSETIMLGLPWQVSPDPI
jgi:hypothetical protein